MMNIIKRSAAMFVIVAMVALMVPAFLTVSVSADMWDGESVATGFASGDGTEANPYLVSSAAELAYLRIQAEQNLCTPETHYKLTVDIDMNNHNWIPIGANNDFPFKGVFDGDNHTVSNFNILIDPMASKTYGALFGAAADSTFKNLIVEGNKIVGRYGGTLLGYGINVDVINCHSRSGSTEDAGVNGLAIGGLIGRLQGGSDGKNKVIYCTNSALINNNCVVVKGSSAFVGGLVGVAGNTEISYCANYGDMIFSREYNSVESAPEGVDTSTGGVFVGGICGNFGADNGVCDVMYCYNTGNITGFEKMTNHASVYAGGIGGRVSHQAGSKVIGCFSTGIVTWPVEQGGTDFSSKAGALFGLVNAAATLENCYTVQEGVAIKGVDSRSDVDQAKDVDVIVLPIDKMTGNSALQNMNLGKSLEELVALTLATSNYFDSQLQAFEKYTDGKSLQNYMVEYVMAELNITGSAACWVTTPDGVPTFGALEAILASAEVSANASSLTEAKLQVLYEQWLADPENTTTEKSEDTDNGPVIEDTTNEKVYVSWGAETTTKAPVDNNKPDDTTTSNTTTDDSSCGGFVAGAAAVIAAICVSTAFIVVRKKY